MTSPAAVRAVPSSFGALGAALVGAGIVDLVLGRMILAVLTSIRAGADTRTPRLAALIETLEAPALFARGMLMVLAMCLTVVAAMEVLRDAAFSPPPRRLTILVLSIFALPALALSIFLPIGPRFVFLSLTATAFVGVTGAISTSLRALWPSAKLVTWLLTAPVVIGYVDTLTRVLPSLSALAAPGAFSLAIEASAVVAGLLAPALLPGRLWRSPTRPFAVAVFVAVIPTIGFGAMSLLAWPLTQGLALRALGLGLDVPHAQVIYLASLFGYVLTVAFHLWPRPHPGGVPELGLALASLFFAGLDTYTPFRLALLLFGLVGLALGMHRLAGLNEHDRRQAR